MVEFLKYIKGYVRIKVWGASPERFMNLCSNRNILLWNIEQEGDIYYMCISLQGFYNLRPIGRKTGTKAVILQRYGLPFLVPYVFSRKVFVLGLIFCVGFWIASSRFIWDISLTGNYQITEDVFMDFLRDEQVRVGMRRDALDIETLEKEIRRTFPQVTWTSAKLEGTRLLISVKENDAPILTREEGGSGGTDLISDCGGTVESMIVRSGVPLVRIGDAVEAGTVLVEGRVPIYNEDTTVREYLYVEADADVRIRHELPYKSTLPLSYVRKKYTGREKQRHFLRLGDLEVKWLWEQPYLVYDTVIRETTPLVFDKLGIPLHFGSYTFREYQNTEYEYAPEQAKALLTKEYEQFLFTLMEKGVQIIEKDVTIEKSGDNWMMEGALQVVEQAAGKAPTPTGENAGETTDSGE